MFKQFKWPRPQCVKYWPEGGSLETKHVANYVLMIIYICCVWWKNYFIIVISYMTVSAVTAMLILYLRSWMKSSELDTIWYRQCTQKLNKQLWGFVKISTMKAQIGHKWIYACTFFIYWFFWYCIQRSAYTAVEHLWVPQKWQKGRPYFSYVYT